TPGPGAAPIQLTVIATNVNVSRPEHQSNDDSSNRTSKMGRFSLVCGGPAHAQTESGRRTPARNRTAFEERHRQMSVMEGGVLVVGLAALVSLAGFVTLWGMWVIRADESGLVVKRFGPPLASGRIIAVNGEAGYQARMLPPGWHFGYWRGRYRIVKVPV